METDMITSLQQYADPAFLVKDGMITHINSAAGEMQIQVNTPIDQLICVGKDEYDQLDKGKLYLAISVKNTDYPAYVQATGEYHLFVLQNDYDDPTLRAFALAAKQLRLPLSNAMVCMDQLKHDDPQQQYLLRSLYQLHRVVSNMSDAALYAGGRSENMQTVNLCALIAECVEKATALLEKSGITVSYSGINTPVIGLADSEKLERGILNLLSNAAKFSTDKTVSVRLSHKGGKLHLQVENRCEAMLTDPFRQYTRQPGMEDSRWGIGLGLTIVRGAVAAHNGALLLQTTETGQRFTMTLSVTQRQSDIIKSPVMLPVNYAGGYDKALLELSEILPAELYE